jgi:hypothetical protein
MHIIIPGIKIKGGKYKGNIKIVITILCSHLKHNTPILEVMH